jgi:hypothetical protein
MSHPIAFDFLYLIAETAWVAYEWLSENITIVLFTTAPTLVRIEKENAMGKFKHIETFKDLTSGLVDYRATALHKQFHFTHVRRSASISYFLLLYSCCSFSSGRSLLWPRRN